MKKKILSAVISLSVLMMSGTAVSAEEGKSLLVMGDSIASGYGLDGYEAGDNSSAKDSFANKLAESFDSYENFAVDGSTTGDLLDSLSEGEVISAVENADTIVISSGGNDFLMTLVTSMQMSIMSDPEVMAAIQDGSFTVEMLEDKVTPEAIEKAFAAAVSVTDINAVYGNINKIIETINGVNDDCDIYFLTVENPFPGTENLDEFAESGDFSAEDLEGLADSMKTLTDFSEEINGLIGSLNEIYDNVYPIDVYSAFKGKETEYTNIAEMDVHPNKAGHEIIYNLLSDAINANAIEPAAEDEPVSTETSEETVSSADDAVVTEAAPLSDSGSVSADTGNASSSALMSIVSVSLAVMVLLRKKHN